MSENNYFNLYMDAGIADPGRQETYGRYLDVVLGQEGIGVEDIVGIGERGTGSAPDLYVAHRQGISVAAQMGLFKKRIEVRRICPLASIARLSATQEGFKGTELTVTGYDAAGEKVLRVEWGLGGPDWVEPLVLRQRENLYRVIAAAMDRGAQKPFETSFAAASSKSGALMDWSEELVRAAGVEVTAARVEEHANMAATAIGHLVFLPAGASLGIDEIGGFFPPGQAPSGTPIETFDALYGEVVARVGERQKLDAAIEARMAGVWSDWVTGCRRHYS